MVQGLGYVSALGFSQFSFMPELRLNYFGSKLCQ